MSKDAYENTKKSILSEKSLAAHITSLGKIKVETEDGHLISFIENLIRELQFDLARSKGKGKSIPAALPATEQEVRHLLQYCEAALKSKKPEWQILAERNGWTPPEVR